MIILKGTIPIMGQWVIGPFSGEGDLPTDVNWLDVPLRIEFEDPEILDLLKLVRKGTSDRLHVLSWVRKRHPELGV